MNIKLLFYPLHRGSRPIATISGLHDEALQCFVAAAVDHEDLLSAGSVQAWNTIQRTNFINRGLGSFKQNLNLTSISDR